MTNIITTIGWFGFIVAFAYFLVYDRMSGTISIDHVQNTRDILFASGTLVLGGYLLKYLASLFGVGKGKCKTCGKRIDKGEMYCFDHRIEAIRRAQERGRQ